VLTELRVRDLAVIADVLLPFKPGLNVLTGETGAGKSMLIDALALLLGERASADLVRPGADRAVVEAAFDVPAEGAFQAAADQLGIEPEDGRLVVRREINMEGRNRAWANGSPTTVAALATLGRLLVDLHGQHEAQSLLKPSAQRDMLDAFGNAATERTRVSELYETVARFTAQESELVARRDDVRKRADYLRHVVKEITDAAPRPGEGEALAIEAKRLANIEDVTQLTERIAGLLEDADERAALASLSQAEKALDQLERIDASVASWRELLDGAYANLQELLLAVRAYAGEVDLDPGRLEEVERRRDTLYRLAQKYGPTIEDVPHTAEQARQELDLLDTADLDLGTLSTQRAEAERGLTDATATLTGKRKRAATKLAKAVGHLLPGLGMPNGEFRVDVTPAPKVTSAGADVVTFVVQLNPGMDARPLMQVASGGELSRIMLALKVVLAAHDAIPTLVFDEVDQGIGGEVAVKLADALSDVAAARQVLVITHLPPIAARAANHLSVAKRPRGGVATADVRSLDGDARVQELARMLGGARDPVVVKHAKGLLQRRGRVRT
jgi:DNA repair protein RecN (Recombination protein N)